MIKVMHKLTALALSAAAATAINLAGPGPAAARELARKPAYSEGLWKEPVKPSWAVDPSNSVRDVRPQPNPGIGARPVPIPALPPSPR